MSKFTFTSVVASFVLAPALRAQTLLRTVPGPAADARFGKASVRAGDQNNDGYQDLLVGAPGYDHGRGGVYCVSGAYLATGTGAQTVWSLTPTVNPDDEFGAALADAGDMTGDGVRDFLVGQPGYDGQFGTDVGAVRVLDGATRTLISLRQGVWAYGRLGSAVTAYGDTSGDGVSELAVGAPGPNSQQSVAYFFLDGTDFLTSGTVASLIHGDFHGAGDDEIGATLVSGFDLDGDGYSEIAVGAPGRDLLPWIDSGTVTIAVQKPGLFGTWALYGGLADGERMGSSIDATSDYNGDGVIDVLISAPNWSSAATPGVGRTAVLSGAALGAHYIENAIPMLTLADSGQDSHFGAAVGASPDLNGDGVGDILIGAPDYFTTSPTGPHAGRVSVFSGASGQHITDIVGTGDDRLGDGLVGALDDLDGDGFPEFIIAASTSDVAGGNSGSLACYRLFPVPPATYCTGTSNSLGCTPAISYSGTPSASSTTPFLIHATNELNQRPGLLFYSHRPAASYFLQSGIKCAANPVHRTPVQNSGGSASGVDCTGAYSFDFNAWFQSGADPALIAGAELYVQFWSHDPQGSTRASLSNAVRFLVAP